MSTKLIELRANRSYLNPEFNGYKLSLTSLPQFNKNLKHRVYRIFPSDKQYTYVFTKLFALNNYLFGENYNGNSYVYYIDENLHIQKIYMVNNEIVITKVWEVPNIQRKSGDYNFSLKFVSSTFAAFSDGTGNLYLLETFSRETDNTWQCVFCKQIYDPELPFLIRDGILVNDKIDCLLYQIEENVLNGKQAIFIHALTLVCVNGVWNVDSLQKFKSESDVYYAFLEKNGNAIYNVTKSGLRFIRDTEDVINEAISQKIQNFDWSQSETELSLKLTFLNDLQAVDVTCQNRNIVIKIKETAFFDGHFVETVHQEIFKKINGNILEIIFLKINPGLWPKLLEEEDYINNLNDNFRQSTNNEESDSRDGPLFNELQIEECDLEDDTLSIFERIDRNLKSVTHRATVGSHEVLLVTQMSSDLPPALALRYDVDACLWQPIKTNENFELQHQGSLLAFGYIQASKQQKKFSICSPDLKYFAICESKKHIFIYKQDVKVETELKNRETGKYVKNICQQNVFSFQDDGDILGAYASNTNLFILRENDILILQP